MTASDLSISRTAAAPILTVRTKPSYFHLVGGDNAFSPSYLGFWERGEKMGDLGSPGVGVIEIVREVSGDGAG